MITGQTREETTYRNAITKEMDYLRELVKKGEIDIPSFEAHLRELLNDFHGYTERRAARKGKAPRQLAPSLPALNPQQQADHQAWAAQQHAEHMTWATQPQTQPWPQQQAQMQQPQPWPQQQAQMQQPQPWPQQQAQIHQHQPWPQQPQQQSRGLLPHWPSHSTAPPASAVPAAVMPAAAPRPPPTAVIPHPAAGRPSALRRAQSMNPRTRMQL